MASARDVCSLPLPRSLLESLAAKGFRLVSDLAGLRPLELADELGISAQAAAQILAVAEPSRRPIAGVSARELFKDPSVGERLILLYTTFSNQQSSDRNRGHDHTERHIVMFCKAMDGLLGGGVPTGQLTEFCGPPGVGKTQLGMQLALDVQIPELFRGRGGTAIYLDTEGSFMPERAANMAGALERHIKGIARAAGGDEAAQAARASAAAQFSQEGLLRGIQVFRAHDLTEQMAIIYHFPAFVQAHPSVKLIVIDSVAFHFRQDMNTATRGRVLSGLAQSLNELAFRHGLAVVVMNHVTTRVDHDSRTSQLVPALGEHWSHCVTNRLFLRWEGGDRVATLTKSPTHPPGQAVFLVTADGVRGPSSSS
ncbi:unnamed protein product, partial [Ectocarpus fasciculatus]